MKSILLLVACSLPHVDPQPRSPTDANAAAVRVDVECSESDPLGGDDIDWASPRSGTGVIVSERHVLTAAHVVACPVIPVVHVTLRDGRVFRMRVASEDGDIAELAMASLDRFRLAVPPPVLGRADTGEEVFAAISRAWPSPHGEVDSDTTLVGGMITVPGDSGAGVYDAHGRLVGLVEKDVVCFNYRSCATRIAPW